MRDNFQFVVPKMAHLRYIANDYFYFRLRALSIAHFGMRKSMKTNLFIFSLLLAAIALGPSHSARGQQAQPQQQIGYGAAPGAEQKKTLLLRDFHPAQMLHAPVHNIDRAKYYVIDVHNHVNDAMGIDEHMPPQQVVKIMDDTNVKTIVILTGMWGDKLQHVIDEMVKPYPGRFIVFAQIDFSKIDDPNFSQEMVAQLDDSVTSRGARLKAAKGSGADRS